MDQQNFNGAAYCVATPRGDSYATVGLLAPSAGVIDGFFCHAGKLHDGGNAVLWNGEEWIDFGIEAYGGRGAPICFDGPRIYVSSVGEKNVKVFDRHGTKLDEFAQEIGVEGIVAVIDGKPQAAKDWYGRDGFGYYAIFGDIQIGQGANGGLAARLVPGPLKMLEPGTWDFVTFGFDGTTVAVTAAQWTRAVARWVTRADVQAAPLYDQPPQMIPAEPKITVRSWDDTIKPGTPWNVKFNALNTEFSVDLDAQTRLSIASVNASGSDHTGLVRQVAIVCPEKEPKPMPTLGRVHCQPNLASRDLLHVFDDATYRQNLAEVEVFNLYIQQVNADTSSTNMGDNVYPNFVAARVFEKLAELGIPLTIECGVIKPGRCTVDVSIDEVQRAVQRVSDAGGTIASFNMDEPIWGNRMQGGCNLPLEKVASETARFIRAIRALGPILVKYLEPWPAVPMADHETFIHLLNQAGGVLPDAYQMDIDWDHSTNQTAAISSGQRIANENGMTFGLFCNSTKDPIDPDQVHHQNLVTLANRIHSIHPSVAHVCVAAWAFRKTGGVQDVPNNLGQYGLLDTYHTVKTIFGELLPQQPPSQEGNPTMDYKLVDYVIRAKAKKASSADGKITVILPDDSVASIQPNGSFEKRPSGSDGAYEQGLDREGLVLYESIPPTPAAGQNYRWAIKVVVG